MATVSGPNDGHRSQTMKSVRASRSLLVLGGLASLTGIVFHFIVIKAPFGVVNSDEALSGLMASSIRAGHLTTFLWGQISEGL